MNFPNFYGQNLNSQNFLTPDQISEWSLAQASIYQNVPHEQVDWASLALQWTEMQRNIILPQNPILANPIIPPLNSNFFIRPHQIIRPIHPSPHINFNSQNYSFVHPNINNPLLHNQQNIVLPRFKPPFLPFIEPLPPPPVINLQNNFENNISPFVPVPVPINNSQNFNFSQKNRQKFDNEDNKINFKKDDIDLKKTYNSEIQKNPVFYSSTENNILSQNKNKVNDKEDVSKVKKNDIEKNDQKSNEDCDNFFDANKRKKLPAWIREGLEKMEQEKQKKLEKEEYLIKKVKEEQLRKELDQMNDDSEDEKLIDTSKNELFYSNKNTNFSDTKKVFKNEEDKEKELMLITRKFLTNILLDVTSSIIKEIAIKCLHEASLQKVAALSKKLANPLPIKSNVTGSLVSQLYSDSEDSDNKSDNELKEQKSPNDKKKIKKNDDDSREIKHNRSNYKYENEKNNKKNEKDYNEDKKQKISSTNKESIEKYKNRSSIKPKDKYPRSSSKDRYKQKTIYHDYKKELKNLPKDKKISHNKDRHRSRSKEKYRSRSKEKYSSRSKERCSNRSKERYSKSKERYSRSKEKYSSRSKERYSRSKERFKSRSKERYKSYSKDKHKSQSKKRYNSSSKDKYKS